MFKFFSVNIQINFYFNSSLLLERNSNSSSSIVLLLTKISSSFRISPNSSLIRPQGSDFHVTNNNFI